MPTLRVSPSSDSARARSSRTSSSFCSRSASKRFHLPRLLQRDELARLERNQLGDAVTKEIGEIEHPTDVAHRGLGGHRAEGHDLRHRIGAILFFHVIDDAITTVLAKVDVEIRHRYAFRIEEALEQQHVAQWIEIGDAERVADQRTRTRASAGTDGHAIFLGPVDEVGDDQKIARVTHLHDGPRLEFEPGDVLGPLLVAHRLVRIQRSKTCLETGTGLLAQMVIDRQSVRRRKIGQKILAQRNGQVAALGDGDRIRERCRQIGERLAISLAI
jgi:hypothetical protein